MQLRQKILTCFAVLVCYFAAAQAQRSDDESQARRRPPSRFDLPTSVSVKSTSDFFMLLASISLTLLMSAVPWIIALLLDLFRWAGDSILAQVNAS